MEKSDKSEKDHSDEIGNSEIIEQNNNEKDIKGSQTLDVKSYPEAGKIENEKLPFQSQTLVSSLIFSVLDKSQLRSQFQLFSRFGDKEMMK